MLYPQSTAGAAMTASLLPLSATGRTCDGLATQRHRVVIMTVPPGQIRPLAVCVISTDSTSPAATWRSDAVLDSVSVSGVAFTPFVALYARAVAHWTVPAPAEVRLKKD